MSRKFPPGRLSLVWTVVILSACVDYTLQQNPSITVTMSDVTAMEGSAATLEVELDQENITSGVWRGNRGQDLSSDPDVEILVSNFSQILVFPRVSVAQAGTYSYTVSGRFTSATLTVLPVNIVTALENQTAVSGDSVILEVILDQENVTHGTWLGTDGQDLSDHPSYEILVANFSQILRIPFLSLGHAGNYTFTVADDVTSAIVSVMQRLSNPTVLSCGDAVFVTQIMPEVEENGVWTRGGYSLFANAKYFPRRRGQFYELVIRNVESFDNGAYMFTLNGTSTTGYLSVRTVMFTAPMAAVTVLEKDTAVMEATLNVNDLSSGKWRGPYGEDLTSGPLYDISVSGYRQVLTIPQTHVVDAGSYTYSVACITTSATLTIMRPVSNVTTSEGNVATFLTRVSPGGPWEGEWRRDGKALSNTTKYEIHARGSTSELVINLAQTRDTGVYVFHIHGVQTRGHLVVEQSLHMLAFPIVAVVFLCFVVIAGFLGK